MKTRDFKIGVLGLGYVGLPLALLFSEKYDVIGYDINTSRVDELNSFQDRTKEVDNSRLEERISRKCLTITSKLEKLRACNFFIVTVPTPIDKDKNPDLSPLIEVSQSLGKVIKKDDFIVYESTVYPGVTSGVCAPILSKVSGLKLNSDFFLGYSPERINPGDKEHTVEKILKVTSGSTPESALVIDDVYSSVIQAGTYRASSIEVAEAAKVIENTQRDINIAFINELTKIFSRLNISTREVLEAASTKWNFIPFTPGLVGGHCIGVDPYYLSTVAERVGINPKIILSGRSINDDFHSFIVQSMIKKWMLENHGQSLSRILIIGCTFKDNCPDIRNSRVFNLISELKSYGIQPDVIDYEADKEEVYSQHGIVLVEPKDYKSRIYDVIIYAVNHNKHKEIDTDSITKQNSLIIDLKNTVKTTRTKLVF